MIVRSRITYKKSGKSTHETRYYLSSAMPGEHTQEQWQDLVRGHWAGVEIRNHWRRDALWGEDRSRTRNPKALANLGLLRNALLALIPEHFDQIPLKIIHEQLHSNPAHCLRVLRNR